MLVGINGSSYDNTITTDDDTTYYYVDKDGEITSISYKTLAQDDNDVIYLYAKDYLVQTLFVEEVGAPKTTYGVEFKSPYVNYTVNGAAVSGNTFLEADEKGDDVSFTVEAAAGYQIDSVKVGNKTLTADKNGVYTVENVKSHVTVEVTVSAIPAEMMTIAVNFVENGKVVGSLPPVKMSTDSASVNYITMNPSNYSDKVPAGYAMDDNRTQYVNFVKGGIATVDFQVKQMSYQLKANSNATPGSYTTATDMSSAHYGDTVTLTVTATENTSGKTEFTTCVVNGTINASVELLNDGDDSTTPAKYQVSFEMPAQDLTVTSVDNWQ